MIPELGKYALPVLSAYGATIGLLIALVLASIWRGRRVRTMMRELEKRIG